MQQWVLIYLFAKNVVVLHLDESVAKRFMVWFEDYVLAVTLVYVVRRTERRTSHFMVTHLGLLSNVRRTMLGLLARA